MFPVNETCKIFGNEIINLHYHNLRFNKTRSELFSLPPGDISDFINFENLNPATVYKCRVIYSSEV